MISLQPPFRSSGLSFWYSASDVNGNNLQPSNGDQIATWTNLFNNNVLNATNGTPANRPTFVSNASNGYPSLNFNGTTQTLSIPNSASIQISSEFCFFASIQLNNLLSANQTIYSKGTTASPTSIVQVSRSSIGQVSFWNGSAWIDSPTNFSKTGSECVVIAINWTGSIYAFYGNGVNLGIVGNSTAIPTNAQTAVIGAQGNTSLLNKLDGQILDMALYRRFVSAQEFLDIYRFFAYRAGLKSV